MDEGTTVLVRDEDGYGIYVDLGDTEWHLVPEGYCACVDDEDDDVCENPRR